MRQLTSYLSEYSESHRNKTNILIHNFCVPAIMWSLLGLLYTFSVTNQINAAHILAALALLYYLSFRNLRLIAVMTVTVLAMLATFPLVPQLRTVAVAVFVAAWLGQFYGHKIEGKKPSFLKDLQFLLIGPVWVFQKLGLIN